ncbi:hypothetical protein N7540_012926 [Penicillium herquei]|nr:hypothetical protein N7540_012926 [Penicillium herquei]
MTEDKTLASILKKPIRADQENLCHALWMLSFVPTLCLAPICNGRVEPATRMKIAYEGTTNQNKGLKSTK